MFLLLGAMALWEDAGEQLCEWFAPALEWIQRWMALFYAPFLVALPANAASLVGETAHLETGMYGWHLTARTANLLIY